MYILDEIQTTLYTFGCYSIYYGFFLYLVSVFISQVNSSESMPFRNHICSQVNTPHNPKKIANKRFMVDLC